MKVILLHLLFWLGLSLMPRQAPVIGIYTQSDSSDEPTNLLSTSNYSYIAASYVKYLQMSGAQVIPIFGFSDRPYFD